jgi:hypothetical protein
LEKQDEGVTVSEVAKRTEAERIKREGERREMQRQRNAEWLQSVRARDMKKTDVVVEPDFDNGMNDERRRAEAFFKRKAALAVQTDHITRAREKADREDAEIAQQRAPGQVDIMYFLPDNEY